MFKSTFVFTTYNIYFALKNAYCDTKLPKLEIGLTLPTWCNYHMVIIDPPTQIPNHQTEPGSGAELEIAVVGENNTCYTVMTIFSFCCLSWTCQTCPIDMLHGTWFYGCIKRYLCCSYICGGIKQLKSDL